MLKLALLAYPPACAVLFGTLIVIGLTLTNLDRALVLYGSAALSFALAVPVSVLVTRRMLLRREKRLLEARQRARS